MGQGTESCGGYESEYNPYDDLISDGIWTMRDGSRINVSDMKTSHIRSAIGVCEMAEAAASFECDAELWSDWIDVFKQEILSRGETIERPPAKYTSPEAVKKTRGAKVKMLCHCGNEYEARRADINRGYGLSCSKSCSGKRRQLSLPAAKIISD